MDIPPRASTIAPEESVETARAAVEAAEKAEKDDEIDERSKQERNKVSRERNTDSQSSIHPYINRPHTTITITTPPT